MNNAKKSALDRLAEMYPETRELVAKIHAKGAAGLIQHPRRTYKECRSWKEGWVYIFHRACLAHNDHLKSEGEKVTCVVWPVPDFNDKLVDVLEKIAGRIGPNSDLVEMRLIDTRVTPRGVEKLRMILPKATIKFFSPEEAEKDQTIEYVNTDVEWIKKLYDKSGS